MKEVKSEYDRHGKPCLVFGATDLKKIHDWLWEHYHGCKFIVILDEYHDEYEDFGRKTYVYFGDDVLDEIADFYDKKVVIKNYRLEEVTE